VKWVWCPALDHARVRNSSVSSDELAKDGCLTVRSMHPCRPRMSQIDLGRARLAILDGTDIQAVKAILESAELVAFSLSGLMVQGADFRRMVFVAVRTQWKPVAVAACRTVSPLLSRVAIMTAGMPGADSTPRDLPKVFSGGRSTWTLARIGHTPRRLLCGPPLRLSETPPSPSMLNSYPLSSVCATMPATSIADNGAF
jgi:hypothetical protein